jgi:hypothetical protein
VREFNQGVAYQRVEFEFIEPFLAVARSYSDAAYMKGPAPLPSLSESGTPV